MKLYKFQQDGLRQLDSFKRCAYFWEMGTGKSFMGSEKMISCGAKTNLIVCQCSKLQDWIQHMQDNYELPVYNLSQPRGYNEFFADTGRKVGVINYDILARRKELLDLKKIAVVFDESSMIKRYKAKRTKVALKLDAEYVILLSGTPTGGKYEELWTQCRLLGWKITQDAFFNRYIITQDLPTKYTVFPVKIVVGYKNVPELKAKLRQYGASFLRADEIMELPEQNFNTITVKHERCYDEFMAKNYVTVDGRELVGDTPLTRLIYARQLASTYNKNKLPVVEDLLQSTDDRVVIFYNFQKEYDDLKALAAKLDRPVSSVNGSIRDLKAYENCANAVVLCQVQSGAKGLNLQKANKLILYSPPLSGEDYMQLLKRIHRIGQKRPCFYYFIHTKDTVEDNIYQALARKEDYTLELFNKELGNGAGKKLREKD